MPREVLPAALVRVLPAPSPQSPGHGRGTFPKCIPGPQTLRSSGSRSRCSLSPPRQGLRELLQRPSVWKQGVWSSCQQKPSAPRMEATDSASHMVTGHSGRGGTGRGRGQQAG